MTDPGPVSIPGARLAPAARMVASRSKLVAAPLCFVIAIFIIAAIGDMAAGGRQAELGPVGTFVGLVFWLAILGSITGHYVRKARRAAEVAVLAEDDLGHQFRIADRTIVTSDPAGAPLDRLTFRVSAKLERELVEMPRARVVR